MKKYLLLISALLLTIAVFAQDYKATDPAVKDVVEKFTTKYNLDDVQTTKMVKIQQRRLRNLSEIAALEQTDSAAFLQKRNAINKGTEASIKMMLNKEQRLLFDENRSKIRMKKAEKQRELKAQGMAPEKMESYMIAIDDEQY